MAPWFDLCEAPLEALLGLKRWRRALLARARGRVLEVGIGTGRNLAYYPRQCDVTGIDLSPAMLERARKRAERLGRRVCLAVMDAERLLFPDASFDTVVATLTLCTIPDPVRALGEMARVCRSGGQILLLDHVRVNARWLAWLQGWLSPRWERRFGCHLDRDSEAMARAAGLLVLDVRRGFFGLLCAVVAAPTGSAPVEGTARGRKNDAGGRIGWTRPSATRADKPSPGAARLRLTGQIWRL